MFELSAKKGLCYVICSSEGKTSDLAAQFSRNSGTANMILFIFFFGARFRGGRTCPVELPQHTPIYSTNIHGTQYFGLREIILHWHLFCTYII